LVLCGLQKLKNAIFFKKVFLMTSEKAQSPVFNFRQIKNPNRQPRNGAFLDAWIYFLTLPEIEQTGTGSSSDTSQTSLQRCHLSSSQSTKNGIYT
jgi:hypothetical protein